jgi:putative metallohydrolase (TIGR04338 family)
LAACAAFVDRVVGSLWWHARFPEHVLDGVPRLRPGNGARQAFYREDPDGPTITLPRRYRTKGVVLHELAHWALAGDVDLPNHGSTFTRLLLDATAEFCGPPRGGELELRYQNEGVRVGAPPRQGPDGRLRYGWDERLRLGRGRELVVRVAGAGGQPVVAGVLDGADGRGHIRVRAASATTRVSTADIWAVEPHR